MSRCSRVPWPWTRPSPLAEGSASREGRWTHNPLNRRQTRSAVGDPKRPEAPGKQAAYLTLKLGYSLLPASMFLRMVQTQPHVHTGTRRESNAQRAEKTLLRGG